MKYINLTPHTLNILVEGGKMITLESEGLARVEEIPQGECVIDGVPCKVIKYGGLVGLPDPEDGVTCIVSRPVAERALALNLSRTDIRVPGDLMRDPDGKPIGCKGLTCIV